MIFPILGVTIHTVGVNKNWTLVFVNLSAQDASILKISVPIIKRRIPKHPQLAKFRLILAKLWHFLKSYVLR